MEPGWSMSHERSIRGHDSRRLGVALAVSIAIHAGVLGIARVAGRFPAVRSASTLPFQAGSVLEISGAPLEESRDAPQTASASPAIAPPLEIPRANPPKERERDSAALKSASTPDPVEVIKPPDLAHIEPAAPELAVAPNTTDAVSVPNSASLAPVKTANDSEVVADVPAERRMGGGHAGPIAPSIATAANPGVSRSEPVYAHNPRPRYPAAARRLGLQGTVLLQVWIDESGAVTALRVRQSSGHDVLDQAASREVRRWHFIPAKEGSGAVASEADIPIRFMLD